MLQRRVGSAIGAAGLTTVQRRFDHDRWYGHLFELDIYNYKFTDEVPKHQRNANRTNDDLKAAVDILPDIDFASSYELLLWDADRLNSTLNRKEFGNEMRIRLEKQANTVARAQALIKEGKYSDDQKIEDSMIARILDEEQQAADTKYVKCIRANELAEDNRLDILPGGSPNSLREKTRWNLNTELHGVDREEIQKRLMAWLPEKYHIVYFDDFQTVASHDANARKQMAQVLEEVEKDLTAEAKANGWEADLTETVSEMRDDLDPTRHITTESITKQTSLDTLEEWSRLVHEYNGDQRQGEIYARAAELTGNAEHKRLIEEIRGIVGHN